MEKITLHKTDKVKIIESTYEYSLQEFEYYLEVYEEAFKYIINLYEYAVKGLYSSNYFSKISIDQKQTFFKYAASCISEIARCSSLEGKETKVSIERGKEYSFLIEDIVDITGVLKMLNGLHVAVISGNKDFISNVAKSSLALFGISEELPNNFFVSLVKLLKIYFSEGVFDNGLYGSLIEDFELNKKEISPNPNHKFRMYYLVHYVKGLKALVEDDQEGFESELHQCLSKFREVWSQKKSLNVGGFPFLRDEQGFISFESTVLAVLAKRKGWEVPFESDYILSEEIY